MRSRHGRLSASTAGGERWRGGSLGEAGVEGRRGEGDGRAGKETTFAPGDESVSLWNEDLGALVTLYTYPATEDLESEFGKVSSVVEQSCTEGPIMTTANGGIHFMGCVTRLSSGVLTPARHAGPA